MSYESHSHSLACPECGRLGRVRCVPPINPSAPDPVEEAELLVEMYAARNGADESNLRDILTNLMLWAEHKGIQFGDEFTSAMSLWLMESPAANDAVLQAWATHGNPFPTAADDRITLEESIAQILDDAQDNAIADLSDDEYGPDRLFYEQDFQRLSRQIAALLTKTTQLNAAKSNTKLVVDEWFQTGELSSNLERVGVTSSEILTGMSALLDRANTCEIPGDVLFRATNGRLYTVHVEAEIVEVAPDDDWALETIAAARDSEQEVAGEITAADDQPPTRVDRHLVDCADCSGLVDERDYLRHPHGEGEVCTKCLKQRDEADRTKIIAAARGQYASEGRVEIDQGAAFSRGEEGGLYVAAWVWVPWESWDAASEDMTDEELVEVTGSFSVDEGPAEFDNLLDAVNACKVAAAASRTLSHVFEHHGGSKSEVWEVDGRASEEAGVGSLDVT